MSSVNDACDADPWTGLDFDDPELHRLLDEPLPEQNTSRLRVAEQHAGFDNNAGDTWIYPSNLPCRTYQQSITQAALYRNTLVVLPTGLGKTFIAAVVMYNIYRWYPTGKVVFMAPTRPLVAQQIEACQRIMPFPNNDTVELTGKIQRVKRAEMWRTKRVVFATPQVVQSDIGGGRDGGAGGAGGASSYIADEGDEADRSTEGSAPVDFPFKQIKLVVIDEAHKAKGRYAYTEVVQAIAQQNRYFRVLALSATPGRTMEDVAEVCRNLLISHLEVRWDNSIDVLPYVHKRSMKTIVVPLGEQIKETREELLKIIDPYLRQLSEAGVLSGSLANLHRNLLLFEQKRYRDRSLHNGRHPQHAAINSNFSICISLYHTLELLERHGMRVFINYFDEDEGGRAKFVLQIERRLRNLVETLRKRLGPNPFDVSANVMTNGQIAAVPKDLDFGHPKFEQARDCLLKHFQEDNESRAIVFCEYRESVMLMYRMLLQHVPLLRPRCFVGHGGNTGSLRALTQKQQIQIMNDFRSGKSNILIATSIGEEGIDVGEVDIIVCFDISTSNPTRFIQRIGRTGRKKSGHVVMLATEGREHQLLKDVLAAKDQTNRKLLRSHVVQAALYKHSPRLVPTEFNPKCVLSYVKRFDNNGTKEEVTAPKLTKKETSAKSKAVQKGGQDLRKFFKRCEKLDPEDLEHFKIDSKDAPKQAPGIRTQQKMERSFGGINELFKDLEMPISTQTQTQHHTQTRNEPKPPKEREPHSKTAEDFLKNLKLPRASGADEDPHRDEKVDLEQRCEVNDFLQTTWSTPEISKIAKSDDILHHLRSDLLSRNMKRQMLEGMEGFVRETVEKMQIVEASEMCEGDSMTPEEKDIRAIYEVVVDIFGGSDAVEKFLAELDAQKLRYKAMTCDPLLDDSLDEEAFNRKLDKIFEGLDGEGCKADNSDYIQSEVKRIKADQDFMKMRNATVEQESMIYDTLNTESEVDISTTPTNPTTASADYSFTDSKYYSQWNDFASCEIPNKSTPLRDSVVSALQQLEKKLRSSSLLDKLDENDELHYDDGDDNVVMLTATEQVKSEEGEKTDTTLKIEREKGGTTTGSEDVTISSVSTAPDHLASNTELATFFGNTPQTASTSPTSLAQQELDIDLDAFLEPFPEEQELITRSTTDKAKTIRSDSQKENIATSTLARQSPDLFANEELKSPTVFKDEAATNKKPSLASKLAAKCTLNEVRTNSLKSNNFLTRTNVSPQSRAPTDKGKYEKSPNVFDMYLKSTRGRGVLPNSSLTSIPTVFVRRENKNSPLAPTQDESVVLRKRRTNAPKRKIFDSDSESEGKANECGQKPELGNSDTDFEEIASTQTPPRRKVRHWSKRRRFNAFLEQEASVSGPEGSEDEAEHTLGHYVNDSVVVLSDETDDEAGTSHMQAMYLQSLKSPQKRQGAFRIPEPRVYNDHSRIYSQAVLPDECSQYLPDSFVVDEDHTDEVAQVTLCPLERAERILRERRRARRKLAKVMDGKARTKSKRKSQVIRDDSDDELVQY